MERIGPVRSQYPAGDCLADMRFRWDGGTGMLQRACGPEKDIHGHSWQRALEGDGMVADALGIPFAEGLEGVAACGIQEMRQGGRAGAAHVGVAFQACFGGRAGLAS